MQLGRSRSFLSTGDTRRSSGMSPQIHRRKLLYGLGSLLWACAAKSAWADSIDPTRQTSIPVRAPLRLFNGKDLSGWKTWLLDSRYDDPRRVYSVQDGLLRISGEGWGYLSTLESYRDYHLVVEFRWGASNWEPRSGKARDSGIFLHAVGPDGNSYDGQGAYRAAIECQIMQGAVGDLMLIRGRWEDGSDVPVRLSARVAAQRDADGWYTWDPSGQTVHLERIGRINWRHKDPGWQDRWDFRGANDIESPPGEWTRVDCLAREDSIRVKVNGQWVNEVTKVYPSAGAILLQCEGSEIFFRRVDLLPLPND